MHSTPEVLAWLQMQRICTWTCQGEYIGISQCDKKAGLSGAFLQV